MFRFYAALSVSFGLARVLSVTTKYVLTLSFVFAKYMRKWTRPARQTDTFMWTFKGRQTSYFATILPAFFVVLHKGRSTKKKVLGLG